MTTPVERGWRRRDADLHLARAACVCMCRNVKCVVMHRCPQGSLRAVLRFLFRPATPPATATEQNLTGSSVGHACAILRSEMVVRRAEWRDRGCAPERSSGIGSFTVRVIVPSS